MRAWLSRALRSGEDVDDVVQESYCQIAQLDSMGHNDLRGYHLFDSGAKQWRADVKVMDQVEAPGSRIRTLASHVTTPDRPELHVT